MPWTMRSISMALWCSFAVIIFCIKTVNGQRASTVSTEVTTFGASTYRVSGFSDLVPPPLRPTRLYPRWHPETTRARIFDVISKFLSEEKTGSLSSQEQTQNQLITEIYQAVGRGPGELFSNASKSDDEDFDSRAWFNVTVQAVLTRNFDKLPRDLLYMLPLPAFEGASGRRIARLLTSKPDDIALARRVLNVLEVDPPRLSHSDVRHILTALENTGEPIKAIAVEMVQSYWNISKLPESSLLNTLRDREALVYFLQPSVNFTDFEAIIHLLNKDPDHLAHVARAKKCLWVDLAIAANRIRSFNMWTAAESHSCRLSKFLDCANETQLSAMHFNLFTQQNVDCGLNLKLDRPQALPVLAKLFSRRGVVGTASRYLDLMDEMVPSVSASFKGVGPETYRSELAQIIANSTSPFVTVFWLWNQYYIRSVVDQMDLFLDLSPLMYVASYPEFVRLLNDYAPMIGRHQENIPLMALEKLTLVRKRLVVDAIMSGMFTPEMVSVAVLNLPTSLIPGINISLISNFSDDNLLQFRLQERADELLLAQRVFTFLKAQSKQNIAEMAGSNGFPEMLALSFPEKSIVKGLWNLSSTPGAKDKKFRMLSLPFHYIMNSFISMITASTYSISSTVETMPLLGMTCNDVQTMPAMNVVHMLPGYRQVQALYAKHCNKGVAWIPLSMRRCFHATTVQYLSHWVPDNEDRSNKTLVLSMISVGEVEAVGGFIMSLFNASDVAELPVDVQLAVYRVVGQIPVPSLVSVPLNNLKSLARNAASLLIAQSKDGRLYLADLQHLGSLLYYLSIDYQSIDPLSFRKHLFYSNQPINKHICAPEETRRTLSRVFISLFGAPESWNEQVLAAIDGLLVIFNKQELARINQTALENMADILVKDSSMNLVLPEWYGKQTVQFSEACRSALPPNEVKSYQDSIRGVFETLSRGFAISRFGNYSEHPGIHTCDDIRAAGPLVGWLSEQDIQAINDHELGDCVETLGQFTWTHDIRASIWGRVKKFHRNFTSTELLLMGSLVQAFSNEEIGRINLTGLQALEIVSALGRYRHWTKDQLKAFKTLIEKSEYLTVKNSYGSMLKYEAVMRLTSLQHLVCGLDGKQLALILNAEKAYASVILGVFSKLATCSLEVLSTLATFALQSDSPVRDVQKWLAADVNALGIIVGGLEPSIAAKIPSDAIMGLQPHTVHVLRPEVLKALSESQLRNLPIVVAAALTQKHTTGLSSSQQSAVAFAAYGYPAEAEKSPAAKDVPLFQETDDDDDASPSELNEFQNNSKTSEKPKSGSEGFKPTFALIFMVPFLIKFL